MCESSFLGVSKPHSLDSNQDEECQNRTRITRLRVKNVRRSILRPDRIVASMLPAVAAIGCIVDAIRGSHALHCVGGDSVTRLGPAILGRAAQGSKPFGCGTP